REGQGGPPDREPSRDGAGLLLPGAREEVHPGHRGPDQVLGRLRRPPDALGWTSGGATPLPPNPPTDHPRRSSARFELRRQSRRSKLGCSVRAPASEPSAASAISPAGAAPSVQVGARWSAAAAARAWLRVGAAGRGLEDAPGATLRSCVPAVAAADLTSGRARSHRPEAACPVSNPPVPNPAVLKGPLDVRGAARRRRGSERGSDPV